MINIEYFDQIENYFFKLVCGIVIIVSEQNNWNGRVFILIRFVPLASLEVVIFTNALAASEENFDKKQHFH